MKQDEFKQIVKIFSFWKIDKRRGNYKLSKGIYLSDYLEQLVMELLERNNLAIRADGTVGDIISGEIFRAFGDNESIIRGQQEKRVHALIMEML